VLPDVAFMLNVIAGHAPTPTKRERVGVRVTTNASLWPLIPIGHGIMMTVTNTNQICGYAAVGHASLEKFGLDSR
jgi:hypothetical protein